MLMTHCSPVHVAKHVLLRQCHHRVGVLTSSSHCTSQYLCWQHYSTEAPSSVDALPQDARVVVGGGGVVGCSVAYHLAKAGWKDIVLIERGRSVSNIVFL